MKPGCIHGNERIPKPKNVLSRPLNRTPYLVRYWSESVGPRTTSMPTAVPLPLESVNVELVGESPPSDTYTLKEPSCSQLVFAAAPPGEPESKPSCTLAVYVRPGSMYLWISTARNACVQ